MMRGKKKFLGMLLTCALVSQPVISAFAAGSYNAKAYNKAEVEAKKNEQQEKLNQVNEEIVELENIKSDLENNVIELDNRLNEISQELQVLTENLSNTQIQIEQTKEHLEEAKKEEESQYAAMKKRIRYMYENGNYTYMELLMSSENVSELLNKAEYISKISGYDRNMLIEYQETKELIAKKESELEEEYEEQEILQAGVEQQEAEVQAVLSDKKTEIENYNARIGENQDLALAYAEDLETQNNILAEIESQEAVMAAIQAVAKEERSAAANSTASQNDQPEAAAKSQTEATQPTVSTGGGSGGFVWPCPSSYTVTSDFGYRESPMAGASSNHMGIDISAPTGSAIVAAASGTVVISQYSSSAGNYVSINHGNGIYTVYMHASALYVSVGQQVSAGETIAAVGSTGYSTGAHLHFGVTVNGAYVNPRNYVG